MKMIFQNVKYDVLFLMRRAGYGYEGRDPKTDPASHRQAPRGEAGEQSFSRRLRVNRYPRFHAYAKKEGGAMIVNLHLDQKQPSYKGAAGHSGEYEGKIIEEEMERIRAIINKENTSIT